MNPTPQEIKQRLETISPPLKEAYLSDYAVKTLEQIAEKHSLEFEQLGQLSNEVGWVLLKFTPLDGLASRLQSGLAISSDQAGQITAELNRQIFDSVRQELVGGEIIPPRPPAQTAEISPVIRGALQTVDTGKTIQAIGQTHHLHIDQVGALDEEVKRVLRGLTKTYQFTDRLAERLKIDKKAAEDIALDVNAEIFVKVHDALRQMETGGEATPSKEEVLKEIENPPPAAPTPNILEQKLGQTFGLPKQSPPVAPPIGPPLTPVAPPAPPLDKETILKDPYLEPVEGNGRRE